MSPPQIRPDRNNNETTEAAESVEIINKIPGVHLDEPATIVANNSESADGNS
jgi:hypothetical protein